MREFHDLQTHFIHIRYSTRRKESTLSISSRRRITFAAAGFGSYCGKGGLDLLLEFPIFAHRTFVAFVVGVEIRL